MDNTSVDQKDLLAVEVTYVNAPENLDDAIQRVLKVEMLLEDLSRAVEIAQITGQLNLLESFRTSAEDYLKDKIVIVQPEGPANITIITNETEEDKVD